MTFRTLQRHDENPLPQALMYIPTWICAEGPTTTSLAEEKGGTASLNWACNWFRTFKSKSCTYKQVSDPSDDSSVLCFGTIHIFHEEYFRVLPGVCDTLCWLQYLVASSSVVLSLPLFRLLSQSKCWKHSQVWRSYGGKLPSPGPLLLNGQ